MMSSKFFKFIFSALLALIFAACAGPENKAPVPASASPNDKSEVPPLENPLSPGNLPPPASDGSSGTHHSLVANSNLFFQRKEMWDGFSESLKAKVWDNYSHSGEMMGPGPGGFGYYNTLFGRVSPVKQLPPIQSRTYRVVNGQQTGMYRMEMRISDGGIAYCPSFICIDSPADKLNTVFDSVIVAGRIRMDQAALMGPSDPVIMISVFKQTGEAVATDIPISGNEINTSLVMPPLGDGTGALPTAVEIGSFSKVVPLAGPGKFTIVITAFQNLESGVTQQPIMVEVYRQDNPSIELLSLNPPPTGNQFPPEAAHRHDAVHSGDEVSMMSVQTKIKVNALSQEAVQNNVGIIFQNYDLGGQLRYVSSGEKGFSKVSTQDESPVKLADLPLFEGYNKFKVTAHNQQLDDFYRGMGLNPPPPSQVEFTLINHLPQVKIKLLSPADASRVEPSGNGTVQVSFCITDLPALPGRPTSPANTCIQNWNGETPSVSFNNFQYGSATSQVSYDASSGIYSFNAKPLLGSNIIQMNVTNKNFLPPVLITDSNDPNKTTETVSNIGTLSASFIYGKLDKLFENGKLKESDNFLSRGISLEINKKLVSDSIKKMLEKYLNQDSFKQSMGDLFKKNDSSPPVVCTKTSELSIDHGDSSIEFLPEGFNIGNIVINQLEPKNDNRLYLDVSIQGFHGEANIRGLNLPVKVTYGGQDISFIPLSVWIKELRAKIALKMNKENGLIKMSIEKQSSGENAVSLTGDGPLNNYVHVNSSRNPAAAGLESFDAQSGAISQQFKSGFESTILCGVEAGLNHKDNGLPKWDVDLQKLVSYNNLNPFRVPLEFEMMNKLVGLDIAYDILRGNIQFSNRGIQVSNIPVRITPSPRILNHFVDLFNGSIAEKDQNAEEKKLLSTPDKNTLGSLSVPLQIPELASSLPATDEKKNFSLSLSEDALNQALFAATLAGMLDLDIDSNFYTNNEISFISKATPTAGGMFDVPIDVNQNGVDDDRNLPVLLRLRMNPASPPALHFLNKDEVNDLAQKVKTAGDKDLNKKLHYFRLSLSNFEMSFYRLTPIPRELGGYKTFCALATDHTQTEPDASRQLRAQVPDLVLSNGAEVQNFACAQSVSSSFEKMAASCPEGYESFEVPVKNGPIISAKENVNDAPIVRFNTNVVLYGVMQGIYQETLASDAYHVDPNIVGNNKLVPNPNPPLTTFLRVKFANIAPAQAFVTLNSTENNTPFSDVDLSHYILSVLVNESLVSDCKTFNEIQIPLPSRFPKKEAGASSLLASLKSFGVDYLNLGEKKEDIPALLFNDGSDSNQPLSNPLYLDIQAHLGICFLGEECK